MRVIYHNGNNSKKRIKVVVQTLALVAGAEAVEGAGAGAGSGAGGGSGGRSMLCSFSVASSAVRSACNMPHIFTSPH